MTHYEEEIAALKELVREMERRWEDACAKVTKREQQVLGYQERVRELEGLLAKERATSLKLADEGAGACLTTDPECGCAGCVFARGMAEMAAR